MKSIERCLRALARARRHVVEALAHNCRQIP